MNGETLSSNGATPTATLLEHARIGAAQRLAWTMAHQSAATTLRRTDRRVTSAISVGAARRDRARAALLRLAHDPAATHAERELALTRAQQLDGQLL